MTFPDPASELELEIAFDGTTWVDVTPDLQDQAIAITNYGRQNEMTEPQPLEMSFVLNNETGDYTPEKADSPHFPNVTLGVHARVRFGSSQAGMYVRHPDAFGEMYSSTPDAAALDVTGDADWRLDIRPDSWRPPLDTTLAAKWDPASNRSWVLQLHSDGRLRLVWSTNGLTALFADSTAAIPDDGARRVLRFTIDVNNGAAGRTVTFETGTSITGPWTALGSSVVQAGTTSIFSGNGTLTLAAGIGGGAVFVGSRAYDGWMYRFQFRNGLNGTVVADADFSSEPAGSLPFTDTAGRVWTLNDGSRIFDPSIRAVGEVAEWHPSWPQGDLSDEFGNPGIAQVDVVAAGMLRRLGNDDSPLLDAIYRFVLAQDPGVVAAYWPMSDPDGSRQISAVVGKPIKVTGALGTGFQTLPKFGSGELAPWLPATIQSQSDSAMTGAITGGLAGGFCADWEYRATLPTGSSADQSVLFRLEVIAGAAVYQVLVPGGSGISLTTIATESGATLATSSTSLGSLRDGQLHHLRLRVINATGTNADVFVDIDGVNAIGYVVDIGESTPSAPSGVTLVWSEQAGLTLPLTIGQLAVFNEPVPGLVQAYAAYTGHLNEPSGTRMERLGNEEGIAVKVLGDPLATALMGPQFPAAFLPLIQECANVDGGLLHEAHDAVELLYRPLRQQYNQAPLVLDAASDDGGDIVNPFAPSSDDAGIVNDLTVGSPAGGIVQGTVDEGPKSTQQPPSGAGRKKRQAEFNPASDSTLPNLLGWQLHLGTWPGMRYPAVAPALNTVPDLADRWMRVALGDRLQVTHLPPQHPTDTVDLLVQGWVETFRPTGWTVEVNCSPAGPYTVGIVEDEVLGRVDTDGSILALPVETGTDTTMQVMTTDGPVWTTDAAEYPDGFDAVLTEGGREGAKLHVTAIDSPVVDTFTRSLSNQWGAPDVGPAPPAGLLLSGTTGDYASTPNDLSLDVTGDIDVRVDATATDWTPSSAQYLMSKFATAGDQRSWRLLLQTSGVLSLGWSPDGATDLLRSSTVAPTIPVTGRLVVRAILDVDNGSGGHTVQFFTGPTINGPWTDLGSPVITAGTTSIFAGTAPVEVGSVAGGTLPFAGRIHAARVYDGIDGTAVTNPAFAAQPPATTTFNDSAGLVWTVNGSASIVAAGSILSWTLDGTAANFDTTGSVGTIVGSAGAGQHAVLGNYSDVELLCKVQASTLNGEISLTTRWTSANDRYTFELDLDAGVQSVDIWRRVGGVATSLASASATFVAATWYWMRVRCHGEMLLLRVWPDGVSEPAGWTVSATDSSHSSGAVGCGAFNATGLKSFDDFAVTSPQTFTIDATPVNAVVKTVPAGSGVRLADPSRVAL